ncbi:phosphatase PAP2 family protein [Rugamonas sp.]|uniref:phosphatase PAP2 family protein n=1 Tax=Rugamonas sp. TaxID=1926287 RepID=UPI0025FE48CC|nr:phosphatase PAP2 family protein [Rugamonas sp.]
MKPFILFSVIAAISGAALAAHDPVYVPPAATNAAQILPAPTAADSTATRAELAELHRIEAARTPAQVEAARADETIETLFIYQSVLGERFNPAALPLTAALAKHVSNDEGVNSTPGKLAFGRVRPYNVDATLHPVCKTKTKNDSYPSGHATAGYLDALVLIEMVPEQRDAILARADDYAHNRLICGVHFPSDVAAGKLLAYATHAAMDANPAFQAELAAAKAELRRALALPQ